MSAQTEMPFVRVAAPLRKPRRAQRRPKRQVQRAEQTPLAFSRPAFRRRKVSERIFSAVVHLRKQGQKVYRAGLSSWLIGGRIASTAELKACAISLGWQP